MRHPKVGTRDPRRTRYTSWNFKVYNSLRLALRRGVMCCISSCVSKPDYSSFLFGGGGGGGGWSVSPSNLSSRERFEGDTTATPPSEVASLSTSQANFSSELKSEHLPLFGSEGGVLFHRFAHFPILLASQSEPSSKHGAKFFFSGAVNSPGTAHAHACSSASAPLLTRMYPSSPQYSPQLLRTIQYRPSTPSVPHPTT